MGESEEQRAAQREEGRQESEAKRRAWREERRREPLGSELKIKSRGSKGGSLSANIDKTLQREKGRPENLTSSLAGSPEGREPRISPKSKNLREPIK